MRRLKTALFAVAAAAAMTVSFASVAGATPGKTSPCSNCHAGPAIAVTANLSANDGTTATYDVSAPGADYIAVFRGTTKLKLITGASGSFSVATGSTYSVFAVAGPTESDGFGSTTVSPVATVVDSTAPVTTSNTVATYVGSAAITLHATDVGSGVSATYYSLDGAAPASGTSVSTSVVGAHTLQFWSVDNSGNIEGATTVAFTVTAAASSPTPPPVPPTVPTVTPVSPVASRLTLFSSSKKVKPGATVKLRGSLSPADAGDVVKLYVKKPGSNKYVRLSTRTVALSTDSKGAWSYKFSSKKRGTYLFKVKFAGDADTRASVSRTVKMKVAK